MIAQTLHNLITARDSKTTKKQFAEYLGITRATLDDYLTGKTCMTSDKIEKSAAYFGVSVGYLFGELSGAPSPVITEQEKTIYESIVENNRQIVSILKQINLNNEKLIGILQPKK